MSDDRLPALRPTGDLAFDSGAPSPLMRRGAERLAALVLARQAPTLLWTFVGYGRRRTYEVAPPAVLPILAEAIPDELKRLRQWVCWDQERSRLTRWHRARHPLGDEAPEFEWKDQLLNPRTGGYASETDPNTWVGFEEAISFQERHGLAGIGFVLTAEDPFTAMTIERCRDRGSGQLTPAATGWVASLNSYTEVSPSGTGVTILVRANRSESRQVSWRDMRLFDQGQYLAVTGQRLPGGASSIAERQLQIASLSSSNGFASHHSGQFRRPSSVIVSVTESTVVVRCWDGHLRVIDSPTGRERWCWHHDGRFGKVLESGGIITTEVDTALVARDAFSGEERWRFAPPDGRPSTSGFGARAGVVYVICDRHAPRLDALDRQTGNPRWSYACSAESTVLDGGDRFWIASNDRISAIDAGSGAVWWTAPTVGQFREIQDTPGQGITYRANYFLAHAAGVVAVRSRDDDVDLLTGYDAASGERRWVQRVESGAGLGDGTPAGIFLSHSFDFSEEEVETETVHVIDPRTGGDLWRRRFRRKAYGLGLQDDCFYPELYEPVAAADLLIVGGVQFQDELHAFDALTGNERWSAVGIGGGDSCTVSRDILVTQRSCSGAPDKGTVRTFDAGTGQVLWHAHNRARNPDIHEEDVVVLAGNTLRGLDLRTGRERWNVVLEGGVLDDSDHEFNHLQLSVVGNAVYVESDHSVHALRLSGSSLTASAR